MGQENPGAKVETPLTYFGGTLGALAPFVVFLGGVATENSRVGESVSLIVEEIRRMRDGGARIKPRCSAP